MSALPRESTSRPSLAPWEGLTRPPRRWQAEALPAIGEALRRGERPVVAAATGSGKSVLIAELCRMFESVQPADRVVVVTTPTEALVEQLASTVAARVGKRAVGRYYGRRKQIDGRRVIVTCNPSAATLADALRARRLAAGPVVCDECHKSESDQMKEAFAKLDPPRVVGLTATPFRSVEREVLSQFSTLAYRYTLGDALNDGVLVPWRTVNWDGSGPDDDTDRICVDLIRANAEGPGIVSAVSIDDAQAYAVKLSESGVPAEAIYGEQPDAVQQRLLDRLRVGELRCLVHVQLLAEGVDLPWLRWLCLRRAVGSAVRFLQEIGRVLRVDNDDPTKRLATIIDPHDLFGRLGVAHDPKVGAEALDEAAAGEARRRGPNAVESDLPSIPPARAVDAVTSWTRQLLVAMQSAGLVEPRRRSPEEDRGLFPTSRQLRALLGDDDKKGLVRHASRLPEPHRSAVKQLCALAPSLQAGAVSDLISVLMGIADATKDERQAWAMGRRPSTRWAFPAELIPPLDPSAVGCLPEPAEVVPFRRTA